MQRREFRRWAQLCPAAILAGAMLGCLAVESQEMPTNARLREPAERMALAQAIRGAARRLTRDECQGLLDEFTDISSQPLRAALEAQAKDVNEYLGRVLFYDAPADACQEQMLAGATEAGSRVIRVCGRRFARTVTESANHAEAVVIHEMLHSLGLGENPPTSDCITSRVMERCRNLMPLDIRVPPQNRAKAVCRPTASSISALGPGTGSTGDGYTCRRRTCHQP